MSGWRNEFPNEISSEFLEEIQILNLQFPIHRFLTLLLRKRTTPEEESSALGRKLDMFLATNRCSQPTSQYFKEEATDKDLCCIYLQWV